MRQSSNQDASTGGASGGIGLFTDAGQLVFRLGGAYFTPQAFTCHSCRMLGGPQARNRFRNSTIPNSTLSAYPCLAEQRVRFPAMMPPKFVFRRFGCVPAALRRADFLPAMV